MNGHTNYVKKNGLTNETITESIMKQFFNDKANY